MEKRNVNEVLYSTCVMDLYKVPADAKMWYVGHIYGDYEMPLYFYIDSNNMVVGTNRDFARFYVGKVGEKTERVNGDVVAPINLWFMDHHKGRDYLGHDECHQEGLQTYAGEVYFYGNKACIWGAHGKSLPFDVSSLPASNGNLYQEVIPVQDDYLKASLEAYIYGNFTISALVDPKVLPLVEMIRDVTLQSSEATSMEEFNRIRKAYEDKYDLSSTVYCKKREDSGN